MLIAPSVPDIFTHSREAASISSFIGERRDLISPAQPFSSHPKRGTQRSSFQLTFSRKPPRPSSFSKLIAATRRGANDPKTRIRQMNESFNSRPCVWINDRVHLPTVFGRRVGHTERAHLAGDLWILFYVTSIGSEEETVTSSPLA
ncbi:unnamed protein product [Pleuronectes platessa]|uniref:Uncharacterized protein n=1 Tax=Pleuronectes platessa TaxID=8262 RepID=A0A9N7UT49_PLEPL|nr:unnamed protein product [Pleuronectes platessa]